MTHPIASIPAHVSPSSQLSSRVGNSDVNNAQNNQQDKGIVVQSLLVPWLLRLAFFSLFNEVNFGTASSIEALLSDTCALDEHHLWENAQEFACQVLEHAAVLTRHSRRTHVEVSDIVVALHMCCGIAIHCMFARLLSRIDKHVDNLKMTRLCESLVTMCESRVKSQFTFSGNSSAPAPAPVPVPVPEQASVACSFLPPSTFVNSVLPSSKLIKSVLPPSQFNSMTVTSTIPRTQQVMRLSAAQLLQFKTAFIRMMTLYASSLQTFKPRAKIIKDQLLAMRTQDATSTGNASMAHDSDNSKDMTTSEMQQLWHAVWQEEAKEDSDVTTTLFFDISRPDITDPIAGESYVGVLAAQNTTGTPRSSIARLSYPPVERQFSADSAGVAGSATGKKRGRKKRIPDPVGDGSVGVLSPDLRTPVTTSQGHATIASKRVLQIKRPVFVHLHLPAQTVDMLENGGGGGGARLHPLVGSDEKAVSLPSLAMQPSILSDVALRFDALQSTTCLTDLFDESTQEAIIAMKLRSCLFALTTTTQRSNNYSACIATARPATSNCTDNGDKAPTSSPKPSWLPLRSVATWITEMVQSKCQNLQLYRTANEARRRERSERQVAKRATLDIGVSPTPNDGDDDSGAPPRRTIQALHLFTSTPTTRTPPRKGSSIQINTPSKAESSRITMEHSTVTDAKIKKTEHQTLRTPPVPQTQTPRTTSSKRTRLGLFQSPNVADDVSDSLHRHSVTTLSALPPRTPTTKKSVLPQCTDSMASAPSPQPRPAAAAVTSGARVKLKLFKM